ncbi:carbohydrate ABC transporter substrate-binding protein [Alginatibacterium sediminis]|uniref:Carbohydrate ABC transporter substrate-binding protein n=1 Tax=Alginatibacterium sediminis TaxID=2164068 RepID=A0A420EB51_9ALTE|nr:ABC transporter substrate-binding protein [Alginatibacterium sediminis]RKF17910.1 carbohydrate ABC transporter substrate-binding protein [Alginatibacterium sediminis]
MRKSSLVSLAVSLAFGANLAMADTVTLDVTAWKGNKAEPAAMPELLEKFHSENPDIKVEFSYISRGDTDVVIPPRLQGGSNPPDVMMVDMPLVKTWGEAGMLADLGTDSPWFSQITPQVRDSLAPTGEVFVQPLEIVGLGNFVNLDLLAKAGVEQPPKTIDQLIDACKKLDAAGISPMLFSSELSGSMIIAANGIYGSEVMPWDLGSGEASFSDDEGFKKSFAMTQALIDAKCFEPKLQAGLDPWGTSLTEFSSGNVAMLPQGAWNIGSFDKQENLNYVFTALPGGAETGIALDTFGMGWAISSSTKHKEAAQRFLAFFADQENLGEFLKADSGYNPYVGGPSGLPELAQGYDEARSAGNIVMWPVFMNHWPATMNQGLNDGVAMFLLNSSDGPEEVLEYWDEAVEDSM